MPAHEHAAAVDQPGQRLAAPQPRVLWRQVTDAPLRGMAVAREAGRILTWDDANNLLMLDWAGRRLAALRAPSAVELAAISDDGRQVVVTSQEGDIRWLRESLEVRQHRRGPRRLVGLALTPDGSYLAASSSESHTRIYDSQGRLVTDLVTPRPLKHMVYLAGRPWLVAAAEHGLVGCYELDGERRWQDALWSAAGHLAASGDGFAILISCFGHGLQRYGLDGTNEGAYHLGGGVARCSVDYDGRLFAVATLEGEVLLVNTAGHVLWRQALTRPATELWLDAAGRRLLYGHETGEIVLLDLFPPAGDAERGVSDGAGRAQDRLTAQPAPGPGAQPSGQLREPTWRISAFDSETQAETVVLAMLEDPPGVAVFSNRKRIEVFSSAGERVHTGDPMMGVGRYLDAEPGTLLAATDAELALYDASSNQSVRLPTRLVQTSHVRIDSSAAEIIVVEERDRLSRLDSTGRRLWTVTLDRFVDALAVGPGRLSAVTTEDGRLLVFDGEKRVVGEFRSAKPEPLALVRLGPRWITLAGRSQLVRSHRVEGSVEWEAVIPTEAWRLYRLGKLVVARAASGRSYCIDARGQVVLDSIELPYDAQLFVNRLGEGRALFWRVGNLMVTDLVGQIIWRHLAPEVPGAIVGGPGGVACTLGRDLTFFDDPAR